MAANKKTAKNLPGPGPGRPPGVPNKTTAVLKDAILAAAESIGADGKGKDGLEGYLRGVATTDKKAFVSLLGRVLPLTLSAPDGTPMNVSFCTTYESKPE